VASACAAINHPASPRNEQQGKEVENLREKQRELAGQEIVVHDARGMRTTGTDLQFETCR
jgi:hypothetical protein